MAGKLWKWAGAGDERRKGPGVDKQVCFEWRSGARRLREGVKNGHGQRWGDLGDMKDGGYPLTTLLHATNLLLSKTNSRGI